MIGFKKWLETSQAEEINGWLSPNGKLYTCNSPFCHGNLIIKTPELKKHVKEESVKLAYDTGGAEYLYFDMWKEGFLRVSSSSSWLTGMDPEMYFEGTKEAIKNLYQKAKDIAENYQRKEVFTVANFI